MFSHNVNLDYSVNINPLGMPEPIRQAIISHMPDYESYPDPYCRKLRAAIAHKESVETKNVLCGNGAAELIYRLCLSQRPRQVLVCAPTFTDYARAAVMSGASIIEHMLHSEEGFVLSDTILADISSDVDILFLCNPNNPTGRLINYNLIEHILKRCEETGTIAVMDECFLPFTRGQSVVPLISTYANLIVMRAFTKIYAMPGLRLGYMLSGNTDLLESVGNFGQCWNVSAVAQIAGLAVLTCHDTETQVCRLVESERYYMLDAIQDLGIQTYPSDANFLLMESSIPLYDPLLKKGILIRSCSNFSGLNHNYYRIAVKLHNQNKILVSALEEVLNG